MSDARWRAARAGSPLELAERRHHVGRGLVERQAIVLGHVAEPRARRRSDRAATSMPHTSMRPSVGLAMPSRRRNIVVLPAPFAPTRPMQPARHFDRQVVERRHTRVPLGEPVETKEGTGLGHTRSGKRGSVWLADMDRTLVVARLAVSAGVVGRYSRHG